ncbi:MAG: zinc-dependent peptidase [Planctomycetota bacterium]|nr:zinc-dependent peptidase [Planctomycetota bacterium]
MRRLRFLAGPFPDAWKVWARKAIPAYDRLTEQERIKLQDDIRLFVGEKHWEGCGGLDLTDEIRVTISAQACLLVLGLDYGLFDRVQSILIYPESFRFPHSEANSDPEPALCGLARYRGEVLLSWADIVEDNEHPEDGLSVVLHEFTHKLDARDGKFDGTPPLESREQVRRWTEVMTEAYDGLLAAADRKEETLLDPYGTQDEAEFLAVATECFFVLPTELRSQHADLYGLLRDYFRQDPAARGGE